MSTQLHTYHYPTRSNRANKHIERPIEDLEGSSLLYALGRQFKSGRLTLTKKQAEVFMIIMKGRKDQMHSSLCLGEAIDLIYKAKDLDEEIKWW